MFKRPFDLVELVSSRIPMVPRKKPKSNGKAGEAGEGGREDDRSDASSAGPRGEDAPPQADKSSAPSSGNQNTNGSDSPKNIGASQISQSTPQLVKTPSADTIQKQVEHRASWYGSWSGKARPVAEIARDHVPGLGSKTSANSSVQPTAPSPESERRQSRTAAPSPRRYMSGSIKRGSKSEALPASTSTLSVVSSNSKDVKEGPKEQQVDAAPLPPDPTDPDQSDKPMQVPARQQQRGSGSWFGWWSRPDDYIEKPAGQEKGDTEDKLARHAQQQPLPPSPAAEQAQPEPDQAQILQVESEAALRQNGGKAGGVKAAGALSSWFWLWSNEQNAQGSRPAKGDATAGQKSAESGQTEAAAVDEDPSNPVPHEPARSEDDKGVKPQKNTGWAFWSREPTNSKDSGDVHKQVGEIAVADTPSQTHPEAAQFNESQETLKSTAGSIRGRAKRSGSKSSSAESAKGIPSISPELKVEEAKVTEIAGRPPSEQPKKSVEAKREDRNILLPEFDSTYTLQQQRSIWYQIRWLLGREPDHAPEPHLHINPTPPRLKKALAIGVHGFFPSPIYQRIIGQPTGTSIRFSNCAAQAIKGWTESHGYECEIEKVALEGEGLIADRVDTLWKLLLNWIEHVRQADFILVACHSQGVPVAVMLVARLIAFGCVSRAKIGICAMAGISLGPFAEYKTRILGGSGLELFDFADPKSRVSEAYHAAVEEVLQAGVKIVYCGSIDDQLVSLESAVFAPLSHPSVYRAVFVDGRLHTPDFLTALIGFTLKLRNLGVSDHGLLRELSPSLAGSLYTGEGHSSLHNYLPIYTLAVRHTLETLPSHDVGSSSASAGRSAAAHGAKVKWGTIAPASVRDANPYFLPWAMRGILEEERVKREMRGEVEALLRLFESWKPLSKGLRDVKLRLEVVRSKL